MHRPGPSRHAGERDAYRRHDHDNRAAEEPDDSAADGTPYRGRIKITLGYLAIVGHGLVFDIRASDQGNIIAFNLRRASAVYRLANHRMSAALKSGCDSVVSARQMRVAQARNSSRSFAGIRRERPAQTT